MKRAALISLVFLLSAAGLAYAHGDKTHIKGIVEKIGPDYISVQVEPRHVTTVRISDATVYVNKDKPAKLADLAVGDRVVIHASPKDGVTVADEVRFVHAAATKTQL